MRLHSIFQALAAGRWRCSWALNATGASEDPVYLNDASKEIRNNFITCLITGRHAESNKKHELKDMWIRSTARPEQCARAAPKVKVHSFSLKPNLQTINHVLQRMHEQKSKELPNQY